MDSLAQRLYAQGYARGFVRGFWVAAVLLLAAYVGRPWLFPGTGERGPRIVDTGERLPDCEQTIGRLHD